MESLYLLVNFHDGNDKKTVLRLVVHVLILCI